MKRVIVQSDWYNALYEDGLLVKQGKPERLDAETLANLFEDAEIYWVPQNVYDEHLGGNGYPQDLADFPLHKCKRAQR